MVGFDHEDAERIRSIQSSKFSIQGTAICKKKYSDYKWGEIVEFYASICRDDVVTVFIKRQGEVVWRIAFNPTIFSRNFVVGQNFKGPSGNGTAYDTYREQLLLDSLGLL